MKITMIGGGAHRTLGIMRSAMALPGVLDGGTIHIHDLNTVRAEAMGRMLMKTPEQKRSGCRIEWTGSLETALEGSDVVGVIMPAGSQHAYALGHEPSLRHGFISSDNLSPSGAMAAVRIAPVILNFARKMEIHCPEAWLINFVNPTAVISGMVNNHTKIRALGVCQGFTNHLWDIPRLFGRDEECGSLGVGSAGINHLAYVMKGRWEGRDLFEALRARIAPEARPALRLQPWWNESASANIRRNVARLERFWNDLGVLIFSTEPDGMDHLMYEEAVASARDKFSGDVETIIAVEKNEREEAERTFHALLQGNLDQAFWDKHWESDLRFKRQDEDVFVRIFSALAGVGTAKIATSRPNHGAITGIKERHVVEYTQVFSKGSITHEGTYEIPDVVHGITAAYAAHQTLLGDALAHENPRDLAHALLSYPMRPYSGALRELYRELFAINRAVIKPGFLSAADCL